MIAATSLSSTLLFTFQVISKVISCNIKDYLRNEHFRTNLVSMDTHGLSQIWLYQHSGLSNQVYAENVVKNKIRLTAINCWKLIYNFVCIGNFVSIVLVSTGVYWCRTNLLREVFSAHSWAKIVTYMKFFWAASI